MTVSAVAHADPVREIRSTVGTPVAVRGGVLMLPLQAARPGDRWATTLELVLSDRRRLTGRVAWVHPRPQSLQPPWTWDPRGLLIRPIRPEDDSGSGNGHPILLARLPDDGSGHMMLGRQRLDPQWVDPPIDPLADVDPAEAMAARLEREWRPDRPDVASPFEAWRWGLLAERLNAPPPDFGPPESLTAMLAEYELKLWRVALNRLAAVRPGAARQVRDALTRRATDGEHSFAAWVADPVQTTRLLTALLAPGRSGNAMVQDAMEWVNAQQRIAAWVTVADATTVGLSLINPTLRPQVVRLDWRHSDEIQLAVEVPAGELRHVNIDRPGDSTTVAAPTQRLRPDSMARSRAQMLELTSDGVTMFVPVVPPALTAAPPSATFPPLHPPLTLTSVQTGVLPPVPDDRATTVELRKAHGRWELFFECRRPGETTPAAPDLPPDYPDLPSMRGREAIAIFIGPLEGDDDERDAAGVRLIIPEADWHRLARGRNDGTLQIHRRSHADRWFCRVVLPDRWLKVGPGETTLFGFARSFGDDPAIHLSPFPSVPWRLSPGRIAVDLSGWEDLPPTR